MLFRSVQLGFEQSKSDVQAALTQLNLASSDKDFDTQGLEVRRLLIKLEEAIESHKELEYGPVDCYRVLSGSLAADPDLVIPLPCCRVFNHPLPCSHL